MSKHTPEYNRNFYEGIRSGSRSSADVVVPLVIQMLEPKSILDVGCGAGTWLAVFRQHGISDILGIDRDAPREVLDIDVEQFRRIDLTTQFDLHRSFDLVVCLEVAEHLDGDGRQFVAALGTHSDAVLFSAAIPGQGGVHHVNEQWLSYWVQLFVDNGFTLFDLIRPACWDNQNVEWWYRQNTVLFARGQSAVQLASTQPARLPVDIVHPDLWNSARPTQIEMGIRKAIAYLLPAPARSALLRVLDRDPLARQR